jgi:hypothetical protein
MKVIVNIHLQHSHNNNNNSIMMIIIIMGVIRKVKVGQ